MNGAPDSVPLGFLVRIFLLPLGVCAVLILFLGLSLLTWPIVVGFEHLSRFIVPYAAGSYQTMGNVKGLLDYPLNYSGFMTFMFDVPLGFLAIFWYLAIFTLISNTFDAVNKIPRRGKTDRAIKKKQILRDLFRRSLAVTLFFSILCFPFVHRYEIFRDQEMRVRGAFDWDDTVYPFSTLRSFKRTVTGKGLIFWDFDFSDGRSLTTTAPSIALIEKIVSLPGVETNVAVSDHHIHPKPKP